MKYHGKKSEFLLLFIVLPRRQYHWHLLAEVTHGVDFFRLLVIHIRYSESQDSLGGDRDYDLLKPFHYDKNTDI